MIYSGASADGIILKNSGEQLMVNITKQRASYLGTFDIVLNAGQNDWMLPKLRSQDHSTKCIFSGAHSLLNINVNGTIVYLSYRVLIKGTGRRDTSEYSIES